MSEVWLARDRRLNRDVAVKLRPLDADPVSLLWEARAVASLSHPNVAALYDYGEFNGVPFLVLEYLCGGTLQERLVSGEPLTDTRATQVARDVAAGLAHAHDHGVVHRDLKPSNVVFDAENRAKLADFGIAAPRGHDPLQRGAIVGTAAYISPEQASGRPAEPTSDVYSFGVLLFQMLTGTLPFDSDSAFELVRMHIVMEAPPVRSRRADTPAALSALVDSALAHDARARPADGLALMNALGRGSTIRVATRNAAAPMAARAPTLRHRRLMLLILAVVALLGFGFSVLLTEPKHPVNPPANYSVPSPAHQSTGPSSPTS